MLFVFYIFVFLSIINYAKINCFTLKNNELDPIINETNSSKAIDVSRNNATTNNFFKMIQNLTSTKPKRSDLKSNVFDKMLSDEMLSIKKHIYEKDLSSQVSIMISTGVDASTPTIEIKQKWPIEEYELVEYNENKFTDIINDNSKFGIDKDNSIHNETETTESEQLTQNVDNKIVGLRSLSADAHAHGPFHRKSFINVSQISAVNKGLIRQNSCTCKHNDPSVIQNVPKSNSQCSCSVGGHKSCTRYAPITIAPLSVSIIPYYATYHTYLIEISTYSPYKDYYFHPNEIDDTKISRRHRKRKNKHKSTRFHEDNLYNDNSKEGFFKGYDSKSEEDSIEDTDSNHIDSDANHKDTDTHPDDKKIVIDIDYELRDKDKETNTKTTIQWENAYIKDVKKDKLVKDVVKDLRKQYVDSVIRQCFCSAFSFQSNYHFLLKVIVLFYFAYFC